MAVAVRAGLHEGSLPIWQIYRLNPWSLPPPSILTSIDFRLFLKEQCLIPEEKYLEVRIDPLTSQVETLEVARTILPKKQSENNKTDFEKRRRLSVEITLAGTFIRNQVGMNHMVQIAVGFLFLMHFQWPFSAG